MNSFAKFALYIGLAEVLRRLCMSIITAYTGPLSKIPGPFINKFTTIPWGIKNVTGDSMNSVSDMFETYGDVVRVAPRDILFRSKAGVHKILLEADLVKAPILESVRVDRDITSLIDERDKVKYKQKRRLLSPGFAISYLNGFETQMRDCIRVFEGFLNAECEKGGGSAIVDISNALGNLTYDVMSATMLGGSTNLAATHDTKSRQIFNDRLKRGAVDSQLPWLKYVPFTPPVQSEKIDRMIDDIIAKRRAENAEKESPKKDIVQIFIDTNDANPVEFSHMHIRAEMVLFMIAGSDTTSVTANFTLLLLIQDNHHKMYKKLLAEIDAAFPDMGENITFAKTQGLPYLNAVINESMRVMPIVTVGLARYTTETTVIDGYEIPGGTIVAPCIKAIMNDERYWPDALEFIPERWLGPYKGVEADRKAYYPFSAGSRNCIGQQFALKELRLILATIVRRYALTLVPGQSHAMRVHTVPWLTQGFYNIGVKQRVQ